MENMENNARIANELISLAEKDQEARRSAGTDFSKFDISIDETNTERLKEIVAEIGWPTISKVGKQASDSAWVIVQHSPDHDFMKDCLVLMKAAPADEVLPRNIAYLEDRVLMNDGKPQIYGTQFKMANGKFIPHEIQSFASVDEWRKSVGLGSFEEGYQQIKKRHDQE